MAFYDYKCSECHIIYAVEHSVNETPDIKCGNCKAAMRKIFALGGITFKGEGWGHK